LFLRFFISACSAPCIYSLSLHDALPISRRSRRRRRYRQGRQERFPLLIPLVCNPDIARDFRRVLRIADLEFQLRQLARLVRSRRSEEHTSELQSRENLVCRLLLEKKKNG